VRKELLLINSTQLAISSLHSTLDIHRQDPFRIFYDSTSLGTAEREIQSPSTSLHIKQNRGFVRRPHQLHLDVLLPNSRPHSLYAEQGIPAGLLSSVVSDSLGPFGQEDYIHVQGLTDLPAKDILSVHEQSVTSQSSQLYLESLLHRVYKSTPEHSQSHHSHFPL
jgi:hypothetical protein